MSTISMKWDQRFLQLAGHVSEWSKDPSTRCGAVIVRPDKTIASLGFNGFPRHIADDHKLHERPLKYQRIIHAEMNALLFLREQVIGYTMYVWPMTPCNRCAAHIIQAGITRIVTLPLKKELDHWLDPVQISTDMFYEAGINITLVGMPVTNIPVLDRFGEEDTN